MDKFCQFTQLNLQKLTKQLCKKNTNIKLLLGMFFFSTEHKLPYGLSSNILYKILCAGRSAIFAVMLQPNGTFLPGLIDI